MGKKDVLAQLLHRTGLLGLADRCRFGPRDRLLVLAYHRVRDIGDERRYPGDPELVSATPGEFRWQMEYLRKHWQPITLGDVVAAIHGRGSLPRRAVVVTFDDGFADNYDHAFSILRDVGVPATFFVSTGYIDSAETFWFERLAQLLHCAPAGELSVSACPATLVLDGVESRREAKVRLLRALKAVPDGARRAAMAELEERYGARVQTGEDGGSRPLTSAQVREMSRGGMEFGSHTVTHPILAQVEDDQLERELVDSKQALERLTGAPILTLSYPNGQAADIGPKVVAAAKKAGYRLGLSYMSGANRLGALEHFCLRRQPVERYVTRPRFMAALSLAGLY